MKRTCVLLWCLLLLSGVARADAGFKIAYTFTPDFTGSVPALHVDLEFQSNSTGNSILTLTTTWAGQRDLYKSILNLHFVDPSCALSPQTGLEKIALKCPPYHRIHVSYDLVSDWTGKLHHPKEFRAVVQDTDVIFNGQNGLVHPDIAQNSPVRATFAWKHLPKGWTVASSFGTGQSYQSFRGQWHELHEAVFAVGDFRVTHMTRAGENLTLAARGSWIFSDGEALSQVAEIFRVEREFWGERRRDSFLVILVPFDQDHGSTDGTVFSHVIQFYLSRKESFLTDLKSVVAHEVFHTWNPSRMGVASGESTNWFTEGFTRYYQDRILVRAGLIAQPEYLERLNRIVATYWNAPDRNWTQKQCLERSSTSLAEYELPYWRGVMIAIWLDDRLRKNSADRSSLDDRMISLVRHKRDMVLTTDSLLTALSQGLSPQEAADLRSFVEEGVTIPPPRQVPGGCGDLKQEGASAPYYIPAHEGCAALVSRPLR